MSKQNNANWDHYKVAGREHPGNQERASSPAAGRTEDETTSPDAPGEHTDDAEDVEPALSDDEGYTG